MEQYIHTLIASDSAFIPQSMQVAQFFELLTTNYHFRIISDSRFQPGIRVMKPSGRFRSGTNPMTGETLSIPISDHIKIERIVDVASTVEDFENYDVLVSGEWMPEGRPVVLLTIDRVPFDGSYLCEASCHVRPEPISTSCWDKFASPNGPSVPNFGESCETSRRIGIFSHPWTGKAIEVPDAGCARFWIEFEFGRFLRPKMENSLNVLNPEMVARIDKCFGTKFVQGWRFW